jgi:hypothetical protein
VVSRSELWSIGLAALQRRQERPPDGFVRAEDLTAEQRVAVDRQLGVRPPQRRSSLFDPRPSDSFPMPGGGWWRQL